MSVNSGHESIASPLERASTRRWVQRDELVTPFLWRGFWPALGLLLVAFFALGPFAHRAIQARVLAQVRGNLDGHGMQWVHIDAISGQDLRLSGVQPAQGSGSAALALARSTRCARSLASIVERKRVEFASGSDRILARSAALLDALAAREDPARRPQALS